MHAHTHTRARARTLPLMQLVLALMRKMGDRNEPVTLVRVQLGLLGETARVRGKLGELSLMIQVGPGSVCVCVCVCARAPVCDAGCWRECTWQLVSLCMALVFKLR